VRRTRRGAHPRRHRKVQRSVGNLSAFRPYLNESGDLSRKRDWRIGGVFFAIAIILLFSPSEVREELARAIRVTVLRPILALQQGAVERYALAEEPARLRAERDSLAAFLVGHTTLFAENRQLRDLLGLEERLPPSFIPAEVVRIPGRGSEGYFQLTVGRDRGVVAGAPIVAGKGLVGRVRTADDAVAFGIDWMHPEFRASAMTLDGEVYGIVEPGRMAGEPLLVLTGTPRHVELEEGAMIVTSGHGGVFPRGIPIGTVVGEEPGGTGWQRNYLIRPLVSPPEMAYVLVLGAPQRTLEGQDLALAWGIRPLEALPALEEPPAMPPVGAAPPGAGAPPAAAEPAPTQPAPTSPPLLGVPVEPQPQEP
jgi:cell shape-determining protein MreC